MKTLITVMAHKEAQEIFDRHFQLWWDLGHDVLVVFPQGKRVAMPEIRGKHPNTIQALEIARPAHTGVESIIRFRTILEHMNGCGYDRYAFFEYDAICLGPLPEKCGDIAGNVFTDDSPNRGFIGTSFVHPPLVFTAGGLAKVVEEMRGMGLADEKAVWDRWFGLCTERIGIPVYNFLKTGEGFADNTIHPPRFIDLRRAVLAGAKMLHGVKTPEALQVAREAHRLYTNHQELIKEGIVAATKGEGI